MNARPLIHGWPERVTLDHPSALCRMLAAGELDVALVSSFEFLRNPIYRIVDDISISSDGEVYSVVVAHREDVPFGEIELDPASQTSAALLNFLMSRRGQTFRASEMSGDILAPLKDNRARLLIGDQAIRFRSKFGDTYRYRDLGAEWQDCVGLPFVYALWLVRPAVAGAGLLGAQLRAVRDANLRDIDKIIAAEAEFDPEFCRRYYSQYLRFSFGPGEKQGLHEFANVCANLKLTPKSKFQLELV